MMVLLAMPARAPASMCLNPPLLSLPVGFFTMTGWEESDGVLPLFPALADAAAAVEVKRCDVAAAAGGAANALLALLPLLEKGTNAAGCVECAGTGTAVGSAAVATSIGGTAYANRNRLGMAGRERR